MIFLVPVVLAVGAFVYNTVMRNTYGPETTPRDWLPTTPAGRVALAASLIGIVLGMFVGSYLLAFPFAAAAVALSYLTLTRAKERNPLLFFPLIIGALLTVLPLGNQIFG